MSLRKHGAVFLDIGRRSVAVILPAKSLRLWPSTTRSVFTSYASAFPDAATAERRYGWGARMKLKNVLKEFERYLKRTGEGVPRTSLDGSKRMLSFYKDVRTTDVDLETDGDMLLFQWGTRDWGDGELFEFDITRQLIGDAGEDDDIWQLHLVYRFTPSEALRALGQGDRWCSLPDEVDAFELFVTSHPAFTAVGSREDGQVELDYEYAG